MKRNKSELLGILTLTVWALCSSAVHAGQAPDIVWTTNAGPDVRKVLFAADSASLFSCCGDIKQWQASNGALLRSFAYPGANSGVGMMAVSHDGTRVGGRGVYGTDGEFLRIWRVSDGAVLHSVESGLAPSMTWSPTEDLLASGSFGGAIAFVRIVDGGLANAGVYKVHVEAVRSLAFSPDGLLILSGGGDSFARLTRVSDGLVLREFQHLVNVRAVAFSPNGATVATGVLGGDGDLPGDCRLWSTNGTLLRSLPAGTVSIDFSPDGTVLATASGTSIKFWRVADGAHLISYDTETNVEPSSLPEAATVDISPDGSHFAFGAGNRIIVVARMPVIMSEVRRQDIPPPLPPLSFIVLKWQGGSGLYQVQSRTDPATGSWQNFGAPTTNTWFSNLISGATLFYRVQRLAMP